MNICCLKLILDDTIFHTYQGMDECCITSHLYKALCSSRHYLPEEAGYKYDSGIGHHCHKTCYKMTRDSTEKNLHLQGFLIKKIIC